jgi:hypothetical protein
MEVTDRYDRYGPNRRGTSVTASVPIMEFVPCRRSWGAPTSRPAMRAQHSEPSGGVIVREAHSRDSWHIKAGAAQQ